MAHTFTIPRRPGCGDPIKVEIDCDEGASFAAKVSAAVRARANLGKANLYGADLGRANLGGANLGGALIQGDKIARLIGRATRLEEIYEFFAFELETGGYKIMAGCRWFTDAEYRAHVAVEYPDTPKARETLRILDYLAACAADMEV